MSRNSPQVNIRLPPKLFEILEAAAYVQRVTPATLLTEAAEETIDAYAREAAVQSALKARADADKANAEKLTSIDERKRRVARRRIER